MENLTEVVTGFGRFGVRPEAVAERAAKDARTYLATGAAVGNHLADQLLLPFALAGGGRFHTCAPSSHTRTNIEVIRRFLDINVALEQTN